MGVLYFKYRKVLIDPFQMLYNDQVGPGKVASLPKTTEYTSQFKPWMSLTMDAPKPQPVSDDQKKKKTKV